MIYRPADVSLCRATPWSTVLLCSILLSGALAACGGHSEAEPAALTDSAPSVERTEVEDPLGLVATSSSGTNVNSGEVQPPSSADSAPAFEITADAPLTGDADSPTPESVPASVGAKVSSTANCSIVPAIPAIPVGARLVTAFGALPNDNADDTQAIQAAIDGLTPGEWLVFPRGRYLISKSIKLRIPGITLYGAGATIHGTNPSDQAIRLTANGTRLYLFTKTAVTTSRKDAPWNAGIAVGGESGAPVSDVIVQGNRVVNAGPPGTSEANSASSAGIIIGRARHFLIAGNTVKRSLADGIHVNGGSRDGRIIGNVVEEVGDDMIAVVSVAAGGNAVLGSAAKILANLDLRRERSLNHNIVIADNNLSNQYWGRGITVVGGEAITIRRNKVYNNPHAAGILLVREGNFQTFGVSNVLVDSNTIEQIQTLQPTYAVGNKATVKTTGHGAIEIQAFLYSDEAAAETLRSAFSVRDILLTNNKVSDVGAPGVRVGVQAGGTSSTVDPATGQTVTRQRVPGVLSNIGIEKTAMARIHSTAPFYVVQGGVTGGVWCSGNSRDGSAIKSSACTLSVRPVVKGALLSCGTDGLSF